jgi:hypothetical protein
LMMKPNDLGSVLEWITLTLLRALVFLSYHQEQQQIAIPHTSYYQHYHPLS